MNTSFAIADNWQLALNAARSILLADIKEADKTQGYIRLQSSQTGETIVVAVGEQGKHAYARTAYRRATGR